MIIIQLIIYVNAVINRKWRLYWHVIFRSIENFIKTFQYDNVCTIINLTINTDIDLKNLKFLTDDFFRRDLILYYYYRII